MIPSGDTNEDENRSGVLLERLSFDQTIGRVFSIWCQGLSVFTVLSSLFFVLPSFFIAFVLQPILLGWKGLDPDKMASDPNYALQHMGDLLVLGYMKTIPIVVFAWLFAAMVTHGVGTIYLGREIRTKETFQGGLQRALPYLLAVLLSYVIVILGYVLFIIPGIYIGVRLFVLAPAIIIEKAGVTSGIRRSLELTRNSWCYVFCCYFIVGVITIPGQLIWNFAVQMVFGDPNFSGIGFLMSSLWMVVVCPLTAICQSVMYFNLRVEKEGFNADVLWNEFGRGGGAGAGTHVYETLLDDELDNEEEG